MGLPAMLYTTTSLTPSFLTSWPLIILDEAQNTTPAQLKMFLTRLGFNAKMIVTGDMTQIDLPKGVKSGLKDAIEVLDGIDGLAVVNLTGKDVVRHKLVTRIVAAYDKAQENVEG